MQTIRLRLFSLLCLAFGYWPAAGAQEIPDVSGLAVPSAPLATQRAARFAATGQEVQVVVRLAGDPLALASGASAARGARMSSVQGREHLSRLDREQSALAAEVASLGGREIARLTKALNAVVVSIDASRVARLRSLPGVRSVRPVRNYELSLAETVPYIGASAVRASGYDGSGVTVAVLDSGIDYTHKSLGGAGDAASYTAAYGGSLDDARNTTTDGLFPTAKVIGGYDFVGEQWPDGPLAPDPDPIDCGPGVIEEPCDGGHGTHVADIVAGDDGGSHKGVAPGASLYAVKVCSAVSTSCSGVAMLQGMEFALDPNGDGDISDAVDVVNLSLGSSYGQVQDDMAEAVSIASQLGVVVVAAAGNDADRPYIVSSPSIAPEAISVAQTHTPSAKQYFLTIVSPPPITGDYVAVFQPWSTLPAAPIEAPIQYGDGQGANVDGCAPFEAGTLTGKIVLVDRGVCTFTDKIRNVSLGGAAAGVIGLVDSSEPFEGAFGGGDEITIPGYMVTLATADAIRSELATGVVGRFDPDNGAPLVGSMVSASARGPSYSFNAVKPEIGAPGASVSADAGSGTGESSFGGTSGATPMIAGSAALLLEAHPEWTPLDVKAALMNTADANILIDPVLQPTLAPITRIGSGEVRADRAFASTFAAWEAKDRTPSLSFGYEAVTSSKIEVKFIEVRNRARGRRVYSLESSFRYADDETSAGVRLVVPSSVSVPGGGTARVPVLLRANPWRLPVWSLDGGPLGGDGFRLQDVEFDGFVTLSDGEDEIHLPWHVLPRRAVQLAAVPSHVALRDGSGSLSLVHADGTIPGRAEAFSLLGASAPVPRGELPEPGDSFAVVDLRYVGARLASSDFGPAIQFGINTFGKRSHPNYPAEFDIVVDRDRDGTPDFVVFNLENGDFAATGQNVVAVVDLATGDGGIYFYADADLNSSNIILTAPLAALGATPGDKLEFSVYALDNYFTGNVTDGIEGIEYTPGVPRFFATGIPARGVPVGGRADVEIRAVRGGNVASPSQTGILLLYRDAPAAHEAEAVRVR